MICAIYYFLTKPIRYKIFNSMLRTGSAATRTHKYILFYRLSYYQYSKTRIPNNCL